MTRKHASLYELAGLSLGALRSRRAAKVGSHIVSCDHCTEVRQQLDGVPAMLASTAYPPMPANFVSRIDLAISEEARQRMAATPATEADRGVLPARRRRPSGQRGWRLPGLSVRTTRLVATAGAVVVAGVGSYVAVANAGGPAGGHSSSGAVGAPATQQQMSLGPTVTYGQPGAVYTIQSVHSSANFDAADLKTEAGDAVHTAQARGVSAARLSASQSPSTFGSASGGAQAGTGQLSGCLSELASARTILLVDVAKYEGKPATIIVAAATAVSQAEVWVVSSACSATNTDVLAHAALGHL